MVRAFSLSWWLVLLTMAIVWGTSLVWILDLPMVFAGWGMIVCGVIIVQLMVLAVEPFCDKSSKIEFVASNVLSAASLSSILFIVWLYIQFLEDPFFFAHEINFPGWRVSVVVLIDSWCAISALSKPILSSVPVILEGALQDMRISGG